MTGGDWQHVWPWPAKGKCFHRNAASALGLRWVQMNFLLDCVMIESARCVLSAKCRVMDYGNENRVGPTDPHKLRHQGRKKKSVVFYISEHVPKSARRVFQHDPPALEKMYKQYKKKLFKTSCRVTLLKWHWLCK